MPKTLVTLLVCVLLMGATRVDAADCTTIVGLNATDIDLYSCLMPSLGGCLTQQAFDAIENRLITRSCGCRKGTIIVDDAGAVSCQNAVRDCTTAMCTRRARNSELELRVPYTSFNSNACKAATAAGADTKKGGIPSTVPFGRATPRTTASPGNALRATTLSAHVPTRTSSTAAGLRFHQSGAPTLVQVDRFRRWTTSRS